MRGITITAMAELECPFEGKMMRDPEKVQVVIRGTSVEVVASVPGGDFSKPCLIKDINNAKLPFYPGQIKEHMFCDRCMRGITLPKEFVDSLLKNSPSTG